MLRKIDKNEKKRAIALAAIPLLAELGLVKTSVEAIAIAANVAKGTVYLYFKTKEEIILEIWYYLTELLDENRSEKFKSCTNASEKLLIYFDFSILEKQYSMDILFKIFSMNMSIILNFSHPELIRSFKDTNTKEIYELEKIIREGIYKNEFKKVDVKLIAQLLSDNFRGALMNSIIVGKNINELRSELYPQREYILNSIKI